MHVRISPPLASSRACHHVSGGAFARRLTLVKCVRRFVAALVLLPSVARAQVARDTSVMTTDTTLLRGTFFERFFRPLARSSVLGDLSETVTTDSALEVRLWTVGWSPPRGLVLTRTPSGAWSARRIVVPLCAQRILLSEVARPFPADSLARARLSCAPSELDGGSGRPGDLLALLPVMLPANPDSIWAEVETTGILDTPSTFLNPESGVVILDGYWIQLELRRGRFYRFFAVESGWPPNHPAVRRVNRVAEILLRAYKPW